MARVTVEDCVENVPNPFDLTILAAQRTRQISAGSPLTVDRDNDKTTVVALREIAADTIDLDELQDVAIASMQKYLPSDEPEDELMDLLAEESQEEVLITHEAQQKELESMEVDEEFVGAVAEISDNLDESAPEEK